MARRILITICLTIYFMLMLGQSSPAVFADDSVADSAPLAPSLVLPADGGTTTGLTHPPLGVPTLAWGESSGADRYRVEISTSAGFADPIVEQITYANSYTPIFSLADGEYFWRVKAGFAAEWGEYSEIRTFVKSWDADGAILPSLISPQNGSTRTTFRHEDFTWTAMPGAAGYLLEIATDATFSTVVYSAKTTTTAHSPTTHLNNNAYFWRVTAYDNQDNFAVPSEYFSFTFDWNIAPTPLAPENDVDLIYSPTLSWTAVEGAKQYVLEIDTEDDFPSPQTCTCYTTNFTWYKNLSNDQEYYWRVKAVDNAKNSSPWSPVRRFRIKWNFEPNRLTPNNNVINQAAPYFSWEPIPGAEKYEFQVDESTSFESPLTKLELYNVTHAGLTEFTDRNIFIGRDYFWRVRGIDAQKNYTPWTEVYSFRFGMETSPNLVYPPAYYVPDLENLPDARDETISHPLFIWDSAHRWETYPFYSRGADFYEVTASANPSFTDIVFQAETPSLAAAPTRDLSFLDPKTPTVIYWRVRAYIGVDNPVQIGADSTWTTRIDTSMSTVPATVDVQPMYPGDGFTSVSIAPVLGWQPVQDADHYQLQISRGPQFDVLVEDVRPQFPNYVPGLGKRTNLPFGTYWWRVRALNSAGEATTEWSQTRHFNLAVELINDNQYDVVPAAHPRTIISDVLDIDLNEADDPTDDEVSALFNRSWSLVASDVHDGLPNGELTDLHVMLNRIDFKADTYPKQEGNYNWVFTFPSDIAEVSNTKYAIYVDVDHVLGSGATVDPYQSPITAANLYLPEYVIYVTPSYNSDFPNSVELFFWNGVNWNPGQNLGAIGGDAWHSADDSAIQLLVPYTALGPGEEFWTGSLALALFSMENLGGAPLDSVPDQAGPIIVNPVFVSDMLTPLYPFDTPLDDPIVFEDMPTLRWRMPTSGSIDGYELVIARDEKFTDIVETWDVYERGKDPYFAFLTTAFQSEMAYEDNQSYYWRVRARHEYYHLTRSNQFDYGPWSPPMRFRLTSRTVGNPKVSTGELANTTPAFTWDRVEGAAGYRIEIDDDINFSDPEFEQDVDSSAYASVGAMWDGTWYWRVAIRRSSKIRGEWSSTMAFTKRSLAPIPLAPIDEVVLNRQPTFQWTAILTPTELPRVSAPLYRLEVDDDPNFSGPQVYETDMTSFTLEPQKNLADGPWYWRVAMVDAADNIGQFSSPQQFYKEYLPPEIATAANENFESIVPNFRWEATPGAAYYEFEYADNVLFNSSRRIKTDNVHYTPTTRMDGNEYFWRVRMYDDDRNPGPFIVGRVEITRDGVYLPFFTH